VSRVGLDSGMEVLVLQRGLELGLTWDLELTKQLA
jgi:hypothetical protein